MANRRLGRVRPVYMGDWHEDTPYLALEYVTYTDGLTYLSFKDVPANITPLNTAYWTLFAVKGDQGEIGPKGDQGEPFKITKVYSSILAMQGDTTGEVVEGNFVLISTGNVEDEDNAKLYVKTVDSFYFVTDLSGSQGIQGPKGDTGEQGIQGDKGETGDRGEAGKSVTSAEITTDGYLLITVG